MKRSVKQVTQASLALMLAFPASLFSAGAVLAETNNHSDETELSSGPVGLTSISGLYDSEDPDFSIENDDGPEPFEANEKVRVIVEVEGTPGLTYATRQGVQYSALSEETKEELETNAIQTQESVQNRIDNANIEAEYLESFTTVVNGFSANLNYGQLERVENLPGVTSVEIVNEYERPEVEEIDMINSVDQVRGPDTWEDYGVLGENMVVGVIDSGIDPSHRDMVLSEGVESTLDEGSLNELDLPGKFFTEKVPYGYNYFDKTDEILETGNTSSQHGMHVAGTVAANGDIENGGIKGVAPEAQLLALKVFGNDPSLATTYGDIYVAAMDDAVQLGVDVLNLSLGSGAGFVNPENHEQKAVQRMKENGVVVSISAGNSSHFGSGSIEGGLNDTNPLAKNPDIGVVGTPSVSEASLSVASSENDFSSADVMTWEAGELGGRAPYLVADNDPTEVFNGEVTLTYAGHGTPAELEAAGVEGNVAVVSRGMFAGGDDTYAAFTEKAKAAQAAGAIGVIVHNNNTSGFVSMQTEEAITIPYLFMLQKAGNEIKAASEAGETVTANFTGETTSIPAPIQGELSSFSSWGLTPDLDFKPEITAPGGNILSTQQEDSYSLMNGTSMASPHVAGGSALVLERVDEELGLEGEERSHVAKQILMNTAVPLTDKGTVNDAFGLGNYYSPRAQGAGQMDLYAALSTPAWVSSPADDDEGKVALRDFQDFTEFQLEVENYSDKEVLYLVETSVQTDLAFVDQLGFTPDLIEAAELDNVTVNAPGYVTVPAGGKTTVDISLDLSDAQVEYLNESTALEMLDPDDVFENGYFVEGFVEFVDPLDNLPTLSVPYAGFNGEWDQVPTVDALRGSEDTFYNQTSLVFEDYVEILPGIGTTDLYYLPSLNVPALGETMLYSAENMGDLQPVLSLLRNVKEAQFNILDSEGNVVRTLRNEKELRKDYYDRGRASSNNVFNQAAWDGTVSGELAEDGEYAYEVRTLVDYEGAEWQSFTFDFHMDSTAPKLEVEYDGTERVVSWNAKDDYSGLLGIEVHVDGKLLDTFPANGSVEQSESVEIPEDGEQVQVFAIDYAENVSEKVVNVVNQQEHDDIVVSMSAPALLAGFTTLEVPVAGFVETNAEITSVTAYGQEMTVNYDAANNRFAYEGIVTVPEDGVYDINVVATSADGEEAGGNRQVVVDTQAPVIGHDAPSISRDSEVEVTFNVSDNFDEIRFYVDDNEVFVNEFESPYERREFSTEVTRTLSLKEGNNSFEVRAVDIAGNETTETVEVAYNPSYESLTRISGENRFATSVSISQNGWDSSDTVLIANGLQFADALAGVPLADQLDAPILLSRTDRLDDVVKEEISRLGATNAIILGGPNTVSPEVEAALSGSGLNVERLAGETRFDTAVQIANKLNEGTQSSVAVLANGLQFADALSVAPFAATEDMPVYLTRGKELEANIAEALNNYDKVYVIGGPNAVSSAAVDALTTSVTRLAGETRYSTNVQVFEEFGVESNRLYVATGAEFADALTGSVLAAENGSGVALVRNELKGEFDTLMTRHQFSEFTLFGGLNAVTDIVENQLGNY